MFLTLSLTHLQQSQELTTTSLDLKRGGGNGEEGDICKGKEILCPEELTVSAVHLND